MNTRTTETITFGTYGGKPIEWLVLDVRDNKALIITVNVIEQRRFDSSTNDWETSELRQYLNNEFIDRLNKTKIDGEIFLLSVDEINEYFKGGTNRTAKYRGKTAWCWTRSPGYIVKDCANKNKGGAVRVYGLDVRDASGGVRPALWLNLQS